MRRQITSLGLVTLLFFFGSAAWAQQPAPAQSGNPSSLSPSQPTAPGAGGKPKLSYSTELALAQRALGWAQVYHDSFERSHEYRYLKLAGDQGLFALERLFQLQGALARTERFYYQVRKKRISYCSYYQMLRQESLIFTSSRVLPEPAAQRCQF